MRERSISVEAQDHEWFLKVYEETRWMLVCTARLYSNLYPSLRNDYEDIVQLTYTMLYDKLERLKAHENINGWLIETLHFNILNYAHRKRRENAHLATGVEDPEQEMEKLALPGATTEEQVVQEETGERLHHEIAARIGEESYRLMKAHYADGVSLTELAERSHISLGALKMKMCRWKKKCTGIVA